MDFYKLCGIGQPGNKERCWHGRCRLTVVKASRMDCSSDFTEKGSSILRVPRQPVEIFRKTGLLSANLHTSLEYQRRRSGRFG